jgi:hypothetical protein
MIKVDAMIGINLTHSQYHRIKPDGKVKFRYFFSSVPYLIAFLLLLDHQAILYIFSLTISLKCGHTDFSFLLHIVYSTLLPVILNTWAMGLWLCVGSWVLVGWSRLVVVDIGFG